MRPYAWGESWRRLMRIKVFPGAGEVGGEAFEFFKVQCGERFESHGALRGEPEVDDPLVVFIAVERVTSPASSARSTRPMALWWREKQVVGGLADGRSFRVGVAPNGEQKLVLGGREPRRSGLLLAPALETA